MPKNLKSFIDALDKERPVYPETPYDIGFNNGLTMAIAILLKLLVPCKECKHYHQETGWCAHHSHFVDSEGDACHPWESSDWKMFDEDYFCCDGERRTSDGNH